MIKSLEIYVILFMVYSVIGWIMEVVLGLIEKHKFVNRGFLIGSYCPIYGFGSVAITILLGNFMKTINDVSLADSIWISSIVIICICGTLEYFTSYIMEKMFHARWWDYKNYRFNINGRICLETLVPFTVIGQLILRFASPTIINVLTNLPALLLHILAGAIVILIIIDVSVSYNIIHSFKKISNEAKDNTEEITKKVKEIISKTWRGRRLVSAFPNVDVIKKRIKQTVEEGKEKIERKKKEIEDLIEKKQRNKE